MRPRRLALRPRRLALRLRRRLPPVNPNILPRLLRTVLNIPGPAGAAPVGTGAGIAVGKAAPDGRGAGAGAGTGAETGTSAPPFARVATPFLGTGLADLIDCGGIAATTGRGEAAGAAGAGLEGGARDLVEDTDGGGARLGAATTILLIQGIFCSKGGSPPYIE